MQIFLMIFLSKNFSKSKKVLSHIIGHDADLFGARLIRDSIFIIKYHVQ